MQTYDVVAHPPTLREAMDRGYQGLWGHREVSEEELAQFLPQLPSDGIFLVFAPDGRVAGVSRVEIDENPAAGPHDPTGYVDGPGVVPEHRDQDLYRPLLLVAMHWLRAHGHSRIGLKSWGDAHETLALYETVGFTRIKQEIGYQRDLR